jgi:integrase
MLVLTGQRLTEIADLRWREIDLDSALITIPAARMKGGRAHEIPLAPEALALLKSLPRWNGGDFVFSSTNGRKSINGFSRAKRKLDGIIAAKRGDAGALPGFVFHDLRRSMRTGLSALPVDDRVREAVIAHARPGLHRVYDQHSYAGEKRECLRLWEQRLAGIVAPKPPADVADLGIARQKRTAHAAP